MRLCDWVSSRILSMIRSCVRPYFTSFQLQSIRQSITTNAIIVCTIILLQYVSPGIGYRQVIHNTNNTKKEKFSFSYTESKLDIRLQ